MSRSPSSSNSEDLSLQNQTLFWNEWNSTIRENRWLDTVSARRGQMAIGLLQSLKLTRPEILEVGCGTGWLSQELAKFGTVTANDLATEVVERVQKRLPDIRFLAGDFMAVQLPSEHFDVVVCVETLSSIVDQSAFIRRCHEVLKPGGGLILTTPNRIVFERRTDVMPRGHGQVRKWPTPGQVKRLLMANQFRIRHLSSIVTEGHVGFLRIVNSYKLNGLLAFVFPQERLDAIKERLGLGQTIVVLAEKD